MFKTIFISIVLINSLVFIECKQLFLTPYIESNRLSEAKNLSSVKSLPNAPNIESHSGFITIDKKFNSNLFFWFFPSFKSPTTSPVIVWLEGGPGASSLMSLFMYGPLRVDEKLKVNLDPDSWLREYSLLYIDNPVGTGYSFTSDERGFSNDQNSVADNLYEFLQQFYKLFNEYRDNELYIGGLSYAGKYVPAFGYKLMQMKDNSNINFKGIAIGNGFTDPINQIHYSNALKTYGLVDEREEQEIRKIEYNIRHEIKTKNYLKAMDLFQGLLVTKPNELCFVTNSTGYLQFYDISHSTAIMESAINFISYLSLNQTSDAIHVGALPFTLMNASVGQHLREDFLKSVEPNLTALIDNKYKVLLFTGNFDITAGINTINGLLENPDWKYYKDFYLAKRYVWKVSNNDTEVAGYAKGFSNFNHVIIRNANHCSLCDQARAGFDMISRFIQSRSFSSLQI